MESPPSPNSKSLDADLKLYAHAFQLFSYFMIYSMRRRPVFVCADIYICACVFGLRIIYAGAFAFELRIFLERRHFE